ELLCQELHVTFCCRILLHHVFYGFAGVDDCTVVPTTKGATYLLQTVVRVDAGKVHGDLTREGNVAWPSLAGHIGDPQMEVFGYPVLDHLNRDLDLSFFE